MIAHECVSIRVRIVQIIYLSISFMVKRDKAYRQRYVRK